MTLDIVFDGPPDHDAPRFVEVESPPGRSINFGEWVHRDDGYWALRIPAPAPSAAVDVEALVRAVDAALDHAEQGAELDAIASAIRAYFASLTAGKEMKP